MAIIEAVVTTKKRGVLAAPKSGYSIGQSGKGEEQLKK